MSLNYKTFDRDLINNTKLAITLSPKHPFPFSLKLNIKKKKKKKKEEEENQNQNNFISRILVLYGGLENRHLPSFFLNKRTIVKFPFLFLSHDYLIHEVKIYTKSNILC